MSRAFNLNNLLQVVLGMGTQGEHYNKGKNQHQHDKKAVMPMMSKAASKLRRFFTKANKYSNNTIFVHLESQFVEGDELIEQWGEANQARVQDSEDKVPKDREQRSN